VEAAAAPDGVTALVDRLPRVLAGFAPRLRDADRRAAVAVVARSGSAGGELLFIRRAEHPLDPWSGHMAFPGGMVDPGDDGPLAAARRETLEELGLDLDAAAALVGRLSDVRPMSLRASLSISPFVFTLDDSGGGGPSLAPNDEVQEAVWIPWGFLADRRNRSTFFWSRAGAPVPMPCYEYGGRVIWGLTLRMVDELLELVGD
jgi:8-oxo-dGTP pyrophosphatase MutT (NUDIX family)